MGFILLHLFSLRKNYIYNTCNRKLTSVLSLQARDLVTWSTEMQKEMTTDHPVRDVTSVDMLKTSHQQLKAEIEAREDSFSAAIDTGRKMIDAGHFAKTDVRFLITLDQYTFLYAVVMQCYTENACNKLSSRYAIMV